MLFERYPTHRRWPAPIAAELEEIVRSTSFYRNKAKNVQEASRRIVAEYDRQVPDNMADC